MSEVDIRNWLKNLTETVNAKDLKKHMDLISKKVIVYGMPSGKELNYDGWQQRRKSEFKLNAIKSLSYDKLKIKNIGLRRLTFTIQEVIDASNGDLAIINKEIILEQEKDNKWRAVEETIKNWKYLKS